MSDRLKGILCAAPTLFLIVLLYGCGRTEPPKAGDQSNKQANKDDRSASNGKAKLPADDGKKQPVPEDKKPKGDGTKAEAPKGKPVLIPAVFGKEGQPQFADVRPGDKITVKGHCVFGFENEVALEFVERYKLRGKEQALSAEELTRAFAEDREGATKKYLNKNLIVEGVVDSREEFKVMLRGYTPAK